MRNRLVIVVVFVVVTLLGVTAIAYFSAWRSPKPIDFRPQYAEVLYKDWSPDKLQRARAGAQALLKLSDQWNNLEAGVLADAKTFVGPSPSDAHGEWTYIDPATLYNPDQGDPEYSGLRQLSLELLKRAEAQGFWSALREASTAPAFARRMDTPNWTDESQELIEYANASNKLVIALCARMRVACEKGDDQAVIDGFEQGIAISRHIASLGLLIDKLSATSTQARLHAELRFELTHRPLSAASLERLLQFPIEGAETCDMVRTAEAERVFAKSFINRCLIHAEPHDRLKWRIHGKDGQAGMFTATDTFYDAFVDLLKRTPPGQLRNSEELARLEQANEAAVGHLSKSMFGSTASAYDMCCTAQLFDNMSRLLVAVELYRARHNGQPPASLAELIPSIIPELPRDPFASDGQYRYRVFEKGADPDARTYLLYSVGRDGKDNNGITPAQPPLSPAISGLDGYDFVINRP